ncbi:MAG: hypothetical protein NC347_09865 [Clostridium sp.]|nr:hypothetical protein [Clostridium sp.]
MKDIEYVKRIIALLDEGDVQQIVRSISKYGFSVPGFSNSYRAPKSAIIGCLALHNRKKKANYEILLENISTCRCSEKANDYVEMLLLWNKDEKNKEELVAKLLGIEEENKMQKIVSNKEQAVEEINDNYEQVEKLMSDNITLRERIKKLQASLQSKKIEIDNIEKQYEKLKKEYGKLEIVKTNQLHLIDQKDKIIQEYENEICEKKKVIETYQGQVESLKKYKENARRIICFVKAKEIIGVEGYNIDIFHDWNSDIRDRIDDKVYDEVWYVHTKFPYFYYIEVQHFFDCTIKDFRTKEQLITEIQGGIKNESR